MAQANTYLQVTELDFADIRSNLKTFLRSQTQFKDYDFEGSAMATLLDLMAYNTHYNAYYLNMIGNEMFLDTAQQRDSVVSRAKELGYTPISSRGATANVQLTFTGVNTDVPRFTIPEGATFTTTIDDIAYTYVTDQAYSVENVRDTYIKNIDITEGEPLTHRFTVSSNDPVRYIIPNAGVDTRSIKVRVQTSSADTSNTVFTKATNVTSVKSTSPVFYLNETNDRKYELTFGDGVLGKALVDGNIVIVDYRICNGTVTNGANTFSVDSLGVTEAYTSVSLSLNTAARGGRAQETIDSVKFNAPKNFEAQNRLVTKNDYINIITQENSDLESVVAFGGEDADSPVFGKVYIAAKPFGERFLTISRKNQIRASIVDRTPLSIDPVFVDAEYLFIVPTVNVNYDLTTTTLTQKSLEALVKTAVTNYSTDSLGRFGKKLRYSRLLRSLDNLDPSILNNTVSIKMSKRFSPSITTTQKVALEFRNPIEKGTLDSTQFTYSGFTCFLDDDSLGNVNIYRYTQDKTKVNVVVNAGTINYVTGKVEIENFAPTAFTGTEIKVDVIPELLDVTPVRQQILLIESNDIVVNAIGENV
jgi:hypothetical protein